MSDKLQEALNKLEEQKQKPAKLAAEYSLGWSERSERNPRIRTQPFQSP